MGQKLGLIISYFFGLALSKQSAACVHVKLGMTFAT